MSPLLMEKPMNAQERKDTPVFSGVLKYFPRALQEIARVSKKGNDQHNPGQPLHWAEGKSTDHPDALIRHLLDDAMGETYDNDEMRHLAKVAWRSLAMLETALKKKSVYLSGSISNGGTKESTFERFNEAAARLRAEGRTVHNPAEWEQKENRPWEWYLGRDLMLILNERPTLYMLKGWEVSQGARLEKTFAELLHLPITYE